MARIRRNINKYEKPAPARKKFYSFLSIVLLMCIFILFISTGKNIAKIFSFNRKINDLKKIQNETVEKNISLKKQLNDLDVRSYEAIARNNLKMSGEGEVLIIIQEPEDEDLSKNNKKKAKKK